MVLLFLHIIKQILTNHNHHDGGYDLSAHNNMIKEPPFKHYTHHSETIY